MIAFLRGRVAARGAGWAELDVGGIGFHLAVSVPAAASLPSAGQEATLLTVLVVREDGALLYGFADEAEREAFQALTGVAGIGPKTALAVLSALPAQALARAVEADDLSALIAVPGIGRKTAQRLVLELKGRVAAIPPAPPSGGSAGGPEADARSALLALGYGLAESAAAVEQVRTEAGDAGALVRAALRVLGSRR